MNYSMLNNTMPNVFVSDSKGRFTIIEDSFTEKDLIQAATSILSTHFIESDILANPKMTRDFFSLKLSLLEHEVFCIAFLNIQNRLITCEQMFRGTVNNASVYPREVVKRALELNAVSVIFAHNHPSGNPKPSTEDKQMTETLIKALALVDIDVHDHIIIARTQAMSFAENGLLIPNKW